MPKQNAAPPISEMWSHAQQTTLAALAEIDEKTLYELTALTLPEIRHLRQEIADVLPAGNLPAMILSGLTQLKGRKVPADRARQDINALLRGADLLPRGLFGLFVAGPAAVLHVYQKILRLAGKDMQSAFPQGTWQFYLEFGLREDAARHTNETVGFHRMFPNPEPIDEAAAWLCASIDLVHHYRDLLTIDWRERVMLRVLLDEASAENADAPLLKTLIRDWNRARPYRCPLKRTDYLRCRLETFEVFLQERVGLLSAEARGRVRERYAARQQVELAAFVEQMTLLAALSPTQHQEQKEPLSLWRAYVGFIWQGATYLLPVCERNAEGSPLCYLPDVSQSPLPLYAHADGLCDVRGQVVEGDGGGRIWYRESKEPLGNLRPPKPEAVWAWVKTVFSRSQDANSQNIAATDLDLRLAACPRLVQAQVRQALPEATQTALQRLRRAPILINWDLVASTKPLAYIRRGRRGIGDHALTIFRTDKSIVFDQSHIFFDGMWGVAVAEIVTNNAGLWYRRILAQTDVVPVVTVRAPLHLQSSPRAEALLRKHIRVSEAAAEHTGVNLARLNRLRRRLRERGAKLTVNDMLLLYRILHAARYTLSPQAEQALADFQKRVRSGKYRTIRNLITQTLTRFRETNPSLLVPMDASNVAPSERLYPTTLRNPLPDLLPAYRDTHAAYKSYMQTNAAAAWTPFDQQRRRLLAHLKVFGEFQDTVKAVTMRGESFNTATLRLLAHLPPAMQNLLDQIPQRIGVLNEVIKGNEVFSNVGKVAAGSGLRRFLSAKDDGGTKELVWGVLTDDAGTVHISLRDFRPFVPKLIEMGEGALADALAQDYLASYAQGLNRFVMEVYNVFVAEKPED